MRYALAILGVLVAVGCSTPEEPSLSEETEETTAEASMGSPGASLPVL
jgi:hypothetical protein